MLSIRFGYGRPDNSARARAATLAASLSFELFFLGFFFFQGGVVTALD